MINAHVIAVAGGSCSGKTTVVQTVADEIGDELCAVISQDSYYRGDAGIKNFDEPESLEFELLANHCNALRNGDVIDVPCYDFTTHQRLSQTRRLAPKPLILVEGILLLHASEMRNSFDYRVFIECPVEIRRKRRLARDLLERGRTLQATLQQFEQQVVPLHDQLVEPSKVSADKIYGYDAGMTAEDQAQPLLHYCLEYLSRHCNQP